jgi:hypothetical protein
MNQLGTILAGWALAKDRLKARANKMLAWRERLFGFYFLLGVAG